MSDSLRDGEVSPTRSLGSSPRRRTGPSWADLSDLSEVLETLGDQAVPPRASTSEEVPALREFAALGQSLGQERSECANQTHVLQRAPSQTSLDSLALPEVAALAEATPSEGPSEVDLPLHSNYEVFAGSVAESFKSVPSVPSSPSRLSPHAQEFTPGSSGTEFTASPAPASPNAPRLALLSTTPISKPSPKLSANAPAFQPGAPTAALTGDLNPHRATHGSLHSPPNTQLPTFPSAGINGVWTPGAPPQSPHPVQGHLHPPPGSVAPLLPASRAPKVAAPLQPAPGALELEALATALPVGTGSSTGSRPPHESNRSNVMTYTSNVVDPRTLRPPPYAAHGQQMPAMYTRPPPNYAPGHSKALDSEVKRESRSGYRVEGSSNKKDKKPQDVRDQWASRSRLPTSASEASTDTTRGRSDNEARSNTTARNRASAHRAVDAAWWDEGEWQKPESRWNQTPTTWNGRSEDWEPRRPPPRQKAARWDVDETWKGDSKWEASNVDPHHKRTGRRSEESHEPQEEGRPQRGWAGVNTAAFRRLAEGHLLGRGAR